MEELSSRNKKLLFIFAFLSVVALLLVMVVLGSGNVCGLESDCISGGRWTAIFILGLVSGLISVSTIVLCVGAVVFRRMQTELANLASAFALGGLIVLLVWLVMWFSGNIAATT